MFVLALVFSVSVFLFFAILHYVYKDKRNRALLLVPISYESRTRLTQCSSYDEESFHPHYLKDPIMDQNKGKL